MPDEASRPRVNPFEIALWVLCPALIVVAALSYMAVITQSRSTSGDESLLALLQLAYVTAPGLISGGVLCGIVALAIRAFEFNARRRILPTVSAELPTEQDAVAESPASPGPVPVAGVRTTRFNRPVAPPDPSIFMRPRD